METLSLIVAVVGSSAGAAWLIRSKLSDVESAMRDHVSSDTVKFGAIEDRLKTLEAPPKRRRKVS